MTGLVNIQKIRLPIRSVNQAGHYVMDMVCSRRRKPYIAIIRNYAQTLFHGRRS